MSNLDHIANKSPAQFRADYVAAKRRLNRRVAHGFKPLPATPLAPVSDPESTRGSPTLYNGRDILWIATGVKPPQPTGKEVMEICIQRFGITAFEFKTKCRTHRIVFPRQVFFYVMRNTTTMSFPQIGRSAGGFNHTTVLNGCQRVEKNPTLRAIAKQIIALIEARMGLT